MTDIKESFQNWLTNAKEKNKVFTPSTVFEYTKRLNRLCKKLYDNLNWEILSYDVYVLKLLFMDNGMKFIQYQDAVLKNTIIWDRDRLSAKNGWVKNRHTMFLLAVKGDPARPHNTFKAESIFFEHQPSATHYVPDYFYDLIANMCPGKQYLEVFSNRQFSDSWHILDTKN